MKTMTASEASRAFSQVLDDAERGETIVITRGGRRIATITKASTGNWGALRVLAAAQRFEPDSTLEADVVSVREALADDEDPWQTG